MARKKTVNKETMTKVDILMDLTLYDRRLVAGERMLVEYPWLLRPGEVNELTNISTSLEKHTVSVIKQCCILVPSIIRFNEMACPTESL